MSNLRISLTNQYILGILDTVVFNTDLSTFPFIIHLFIQDRILFKLVNMLT